MTERGSELDDAALITALAGAEPTAPRPLGGLLERLAAAGQIRGAVEPGARDRAVRGIAYDSRRVGPGSVFVAVPGAHADGHAFVGQAVARGAVAVVVERPAGDAGTATQVVVDRSQLALAVVAAWWYDDPGRRLGVIGVTGTDGKTTTAAMAVAALEAAGVRTGLVSTAEQKIGPHRAATLAHVTTPEAPELQRALRAMVRAGDAAAVVESTSHGLALQRVGEIPYDVAVLTNLTHEHLEFHGTFAAYRAAKRSLFERLAGGVGLPSKPSSLPGGRPWPQGGIVNIDDPSADVFVAATRAAGATVLTYGAGSGADVRVTAVDETPDGIRARVSTPRGAAVVTLPLVGRFNIHNALAVVALGELLGLDPEAVRGGLAGFPGVRGRMERVDRGQPFLVVVDYAHTPASLATALDALAPLVGPGAGLIAVFGSAGERDVAKRAIQGRVAGERCRLVVATDEDPRGEDPAAILEQIARGAEAAGRRRGEDLFLVADRETAIRAAFARARPGDVVLLAGKGHERGILYADRARAWDARAVAERLLAERGFGEESGPEPP
ncbi:MAG: UDP-N-acetylmuramoyl-L-alanyl-D-glutamate--2,6-diaminopimelate ligase [Chloroflexota bacterium]